MKAALFYEHGGIEKLLYEEVPDLTISDDEVLIRVKACSINHLDIWVRQGIPAYKVSLPHISGQDVAGVVKEFGASVKGIKRGERVFFAPGISCFTCRECYAGDDNLCADYKIRGARIQGGYAEYAKARAQDVIPVPDNLTFEEAAAFPLTYLTAWHMLFTRAGLKAGDDVLVLAAGSGIGCAAVKMAKLAGARVIATGGSPAKLHKALEIGADEAISHTGDDFSKKVRELTAGRGVDVVFEHIGPATWERSLQSLAKGGRLVTCGATTGPEVLIDLRYTFMKQHAILGSVMGTKKELLQITGLLGKGAIKPVIDAVFPLKEASQGQERMLKRENFGKIILIP
jgi:NADPH:quinone reductase-like Zn-dependent oxidoreductase